jgi:hypothetical protein
MEISYSLRKFIMRGLPIRAIERFRVSRDLKGGAVPILVLQPGKVGSSSIFDGLKGNQSEHPVYHLHNISNRTIAKWEGYYRERGTYVRHHLVIARILNQLMAEGRLPKVFVVSAVREPISRRISSFFENYNVSHPELDDSDEAVFVRRSIEALQSIFTEESEELCNHGIRWIEEEIEQPFDLSVLEQSFDYDSNFMLCGNDRAKVVLFRMEHLNESFEAGVEALLGRPIALGDRNVGDRKHYAEAYSQVKRELRLPKDVLENMMGSRFMQTFYQDRCDELLQKWSD